MFTIGKVRIGFTKIIAIGFAVMILIGSGLLSLPIASRDGFAMPFTNALFTSASATCVTGLVVYDTYTQFSLFGQIVILVLIQIGGLGFMTVAIFFSMIVGRKIGLKQRSLLMETVNNFQIGGIIRMIRRVLIGTAIFEGVGAVLLALRFCPVMGIKEGIYSAVFHSISAFCNAGFDLMGRISPYSSFVHFQGDVLVNIVLMVLIFVGGIGFVVWNDIADNRLHFSRYKLHTKIVLIVSVVLIVAGTALFYMLEENNTLAGLPMGERILASLFQSTTARTAGFNTLDMNALTSGGSFLMMILMLIGASPGSTGGGIKTTTFVVILLSAISYIRNDDDINIYHRRLGESLIKRAFSTSTIYIILVLAGSFLLITTQSIGMKDAAFETLSAIGTVGLSTGITRELGTFSRLVIVMLMYSGRVGSLTVAMAMTVRINRTRFKNPEEKITVG